MLDALNKPWITLLTLTLFCGLAWYSHIDRNHGYSANDRAKMDNIIERVIISNMTPQEKIRYLYGE